MSILPIVDGQTGSGKSHSMGMLATDDGEEEGIIHALFEIFLPQ